MPQSQSKLNSVQNGFLCDARWHQCFDDYQIGIDPDDDYRITDFHDRDGQSPVDGRIFYINPDIPPHESPSAELLKDHYHQCIMATLRAAEPGIDRHVDPEIHLSNGGFDLSNDFWKSHEGQQQLAAEMRDRLE